MKLLRPVLVTLSLCAFSLAAAAAQGDGDASPGGGPRASETDIPVCGREGACITWKPVEGPSTIVVTDYATPKPYCEDVRGDQKVHRYGPSTGFLIFFPHDGSLGPSCPYGAGTENPTFDGHYEYAFGGAWLVSGTNAPQAAACGWPYPDHPAFPTVRVFDAALSAVPADVAFSVYSDTLNNVPPVDPNEPDCGDFESDFGVDCINHCTIGFPPGLDQTYQVYVNGVLGIVMTN